MSDHCEQITGWLEVPLIFIGGALYLLSVFSFVLLLALTTGKPSRLLFCSIIYGKFLFLIFVYSVVGVRFGTLSDVFTEKLEHL